MWQSVKKERRARVHKDVERLVLFSLKDSIKKCWDGLKSKKERRERKSSKK